MPTASKVIYNMKNENVSHLVGFVNDQIVRVDRNLKRFERWGLRKCVRTPASSTMLRVLMPGTPQGPCSHRSSQ